MNPKVKNAAVAVAVSPLMLVGLVVVAIIKALEALRVIKIDKP
jgi:hypothetical protein